MIYNIIIFLQLFFNYQMKREVMIMKKKIIALIMSLIVIFSTIIPSTTVSASADLVWGPIVVGNIQFIMTNSHSHTFGEFKGNVEHVNLHITNIKNPRAKKDILNYHIVKYTDGNSDCLYVYDSIAKKVIINKCFRNWTDAAKEIASTANATLKKVLSEADWIATAAIWAVLVIAIAQAISALSTAVLIAI